MKTLISFLVLWPAIGLTQIHQPLQAISEARAGITTTSNFWFYPTNPAALALINHSAISLDAQNKFGLAALNRYSISYIQKLNNAGLSLGLAQFGYSLYKETNSHLAYGLNLSSKLAAGVEFGYQRIFVAESTRKNQSTGVGLAINWKPSEQLELGSRLNLNKSATAQEYCFQLGLNYALDKKLHLLTEWAKTTNKKMVLAVALEYEPTKGVLLFYGLKNKAFNNSFGVGFAKHQFKLLLATQVHPVLGWSPSISLIYKLSQ